MDNIRRKVMNRYLAIMSNSIREDDQAIEKNIEISLNGYSYLELVKPLILHDNLIRHVKFRQIANRYNVDISTVRRVVLKARGKSDT